MDRFGGAQLPLRGAALRRTALHRAIWKAKGRR